MSESDTDYEFIGSKNSYYSAKVRACLQYKRLPYSEVCANADTIGRVIRLTGNHFYPVVVCPDGTVLQDSCDIVEALEARHPARPVLLESPVLALLATLFETVADEFMIRSTIYYRWLAEDTRDWSVQMFQQICSERMPDAGAREAARANAQHIAGKISSRVSSMSPAIQAASRRITKKICTRLDTHLRDTPFLLGDRPSLADLAMMNALYGHLYRDPGEACDHIHWRCISLSLWIDHMHAAAGESDRGGLFAAESLGPVVETFGSVYGPLMRATLDAADASLPEQEIGAEPIRVFGPVELQLGDAPLLYVPTAYTAWKLQRLRDRYRAVPAAERADADAWLTRAGVLDVCQREPRWRLEKRGHLALELSPPVQSV